MTPDTEIIDRKNEQDLFGRLIELEDEARLLTLRDRGGQGKSSLLKVMRYSCARRPAPVSLIPVDELEEQTPLAFVKKIRKDLRQSGLSFPRFDELDSRRLDGERRLKEHDDVGAAVREALHGIGGAASFQSHVSADASTLNPDATVAGIVINFGDRAGQGVTKEEVEDLRGECLATFLEEFSAHCNERLVVVMIDALEHCEPTLKEWLLLHFLNDFCFHVERRPAQLVVVMAGREVPDCRGILDEGRYGRLVVPIDALSPLEREHVLELFAMQGVENPRDDEVEFISRQLRQGRSVEQALRIITVLREP